MSIASAFLDPTFYDGLTNVHIVSPPSNIPEVGIFTSAPTDNSQVVIDKVNRLVHIFINVSGNLSATSFNAGNILWQYEAFQNPIGNELPSLIQIFSNNINARLSFVPPFPGPTTVSDIYLTDDGGNINLEFTNNISGLSTSGNTEISGTIIYPF